MADPIANTAKTVGSPGVQKTLAKPIANVPIGVWAAVIAASLAFAYMRSKKTAATNAAAAQPSNALVYTGTGNGTNATNATPTTGSAFQTNEAWGQAAKNYLIGQGVDGKEASDAVDLYLAGQALNSKQNASISNAIRAIGSPPQSLPPTTGIPSNVSDPYSNYASKHVNYDRQGGDLIGQVYTVMEGDNVGTIARKAYGYNPKDYSALEFQMNNILNSNWQQIPDAKNIPVGTKLYIPVLSSQDYPGYGPNIPEYGYKAVAGKGDARDWAVGAGFIPESAIKYHDATIPDPTA